MLLYATTKSLYEHIKTTIKSDLKPNLDTFPIVTGKKLLKTIPKDSELEKLIEIEEKLDFEFCKAVSAKDSEKIKDLMNQYREIGISISPTLHNYNRLIGYEDKNKMIELASA